MVEIFLSSHFKMTSITFDNSIHEIFLFCLSKPSAVYCGKRKNIWYFMESWIICKSFSNVWHRNEEGNNLSLMWSCELSHVFYIDLNIWPHREVYVRQATLPCQYQYRNLHLSSFSASRPLAALNSHLCCNNASWPAASVCNIGSAPLSRTDARTASSIQHQSFCYSRTVTKKCV